jgi:hypothetical protein
MLLDELKKNILKIKLITSIILNFLRLRDLHYSENSSDLIDKISNVKSFSVFFLDILQFNVYSMLINSVDYYNKAKKGYSFLLDKIKCYENL